MTLSRLSGRVLGRVQGVGFRAFTKKAAHQFQLSGWVKNEPDGSVSFEVQGALDALEQFKETIKKGPIFSRVDELELQDLTQNVEDHGFSILR